MRLTNYVPLLAKFRLYYYKTNQICPSPSQISPLLMSLKHVTTLNIFYCSKRQKDKTQVKQLRQSSPITYISKYTIEHNDI
jgi:hypothetical protein